MIWIGTLPLTGLTLTTFGGLVPAKTAMVSMPWKSRTLAIS